MPSAKQETISHLVTVNLEWLEIQTLNVMLKNQFQDQNVQPTPNVHRNWRVSAKDVKILASIRTFARKIKCAQFSTLYLWERSSANVHQTPSLTSMEIVHQSLETSQPAEPTTNALITINVSMDIVFSHAMLTAVEWMLCVNRRDIELSAHVNKVIKAILTSNVRKHWIHHRPNATLTTIVHSTEHATKANASTLAV